MKCMLPCLQEDGDVHVPLVMACEHGSLEVVKLLLEHHADVHKQSKVAIWNQRRELHTFTSLYYVFSLYRMGLQQCLLLVKRVISMLSRYYKLMEHPLMPFQR